MTRSRRTELVWLFAGLAVMTACEPKPQLYSDTPRKIKVLVESGIFVRKEPHGAAPALGQALHDTVYQVIDARPAYYRVSLPDQQTGWISANLDENWTLRVDDYQVKILYEEGLAVREKPYNRESTRVGVALPGYIFDIQETEYSWFKVALPSGKKGWIYAGKPGFRYVEGVRY